MNQKLQDMSRHLADESTELLSLEDFFRIITRYKNIVIVIVIASVISAFFYTRTLPSVYRADVLMITLDISNASSLVLSESSISSLMEGKSSSGSIGIPVKQAISRIKTRKFMLRYIDSHGLKPILFPEQWNENDDAWINQEPSNIEASDLLSSMISSEVDPRSRVGLTTLFVNWENPSDINKVSDLANSLAESINLVEKKRAIFEAKNNKLFLERELEKTSLTSSRSIIFRLIESEIRKIMMVNVKEESVFKIIDQALPPKQEQNKSIFAIIFIVTIFGTLLGVFMSIFINNFKRN